MDLILWRHADAEDHRPGLGDLDRRLTAKGRKQARRMATWLGERIPADARILVSPALRAQETADALDRTYQVLPDIAPDASAQHLLSAAGWPHGHGTILLVGHQPTLGEAAALALSGRVLEWPIRKGAIWWLSAQGGTTTLRAVIDTKLMDGEP